MSQPIIAYYRVSTKQQGRSGLGLEGQKAALLTYAQQTGSPIVAEYREVESGKRKDRPELAKAIAHARRAGAVLVVAKLDRLARNAAFLLTLRDSGLPLVFCDMPFANSLTIGIMAVVAQEEARMISERTKAALQAAKARGVRLGSARKGHWEGREKARREGGVKGSKAGAKAVWAAAQTAYNDLLPTIRELRENGATLREVAAHLNTQGHTTRHGKAWNPSQVSRVAALANLNTPS